MSDEVRTRWPEWQELFDRDLVVMPRNDGSFAPLCLTPGIEREKLASLRGGLSDLPHYFISPECIPLVNSEECSRSIGAIRRAGLDVLQHESCVVEFDRSERDDVRTRYFVVVTQRDFPISDSEVIYHPFICRVLAVTQLNPALAERYYAQCKLFSPEVFSRMGPVPPRRWALVGRSTYLYAMVGPEYVLPGETVPVGAESVHVATTVCPWLRESEWNPEPNQNVDQVLVAAGLSALRCLLALLRTRGIQRAEVAVPRLNKRRAASGRDPIPDHTVVKLGSYFERSGRERSYDTSREGTRQRMHYRSAHTRRVHYGPRAEGRTREQLILGYIVNYVDGAEPPGPRPKIIRAGPAQIST